VFSFPFLTDNIIKAMELARVLLKIGKSPFAPIVLLTQVRCGDESTSLIFCHARSLTGALGILVASQCQQALRSLPDCIISETSVRESLLMNLTE